MLLGFRACLGQPEHNPIFGVTSGLAVIRSELSIASVKQSGNQVDVGEDSASRLIGNSPRTGLLNSLNSLLGWSQACAEDNSSSAVRNFAPTTEESNHEGRNTL